MSTPFDPYHKWFGIPASQQPPTHYRLLGIELYESDREVIDAAANQRMVYLQDLAGGEHGAHTQKLLNEVSAARRCLLNPTAKAEYDQKIRAAQAPVPQVLPSFMPAPVAVEPETEFAGLDLASTVDTASPTEVRRRSTTRLEKTTPEQAPAKKKWLWVAASVAGLVVVGGALAMSIGGSDDKAVAENTSEPQAVKAPTRPSTRKPQDNAAKSDPGTTEKKSSDKKSAENAKSTTKPTPPPVAKQPSAPPKAQAFHFVPTGRILADVVNVIPLQGEYHLFYTSYPVGRPKERALGLAISKDMLTWKAVQGDPKLTAMPGCVVLDASNSSGLGKGGAPLVGIVRETPKKDVTAFRLVSSLDMGKTWVAAPVVLKLPSQKPGANRQRVLFHPPTKRWLLALSHREDSKAKVKVAKVAFYASENLSDWTALNEITFPDDKVITDLFLVRSEAKPDEVKLGLLVDGNTLRLAEFDGQQITLPAKAPTATLERSGNVVNARVCEMPDNRKVLLGVLQTKYDTAKGSSDASLTVPTEVTMTSADASLRVEQRPIQELAKLSTGKPLEIPSVAGSGNVLQSHAKAFTDAANRYLLEFDVTGEPKATCELKVRGIPIGIGKKLSVGEKDPSPRVPTFPVKVSIVSDHRTLEVTLGDTSYSLFVPATSDTSNVSLTGDTSKITNFKLTPLGGATPPKPPVQAPAPKTAAPKSTASQPPPKAPAPKAPAPK